MIIVIEMLMFILNFSFDAILHIYANKIINPPTIIKNVIIGNHEEFVILFMIIMMIIVCIKSDIPNDIGFFIIRFIVEIIIVIFIIVNLISVSILLKI